MINKEKNLRLSFLNFDGGSQNCQESRCITNSLPKSSLSQRKVKRDRKIFTALSSRLQQARFSESQNQIRPSLMEELTKSTSIGRGSSFFQRNSSLACLRINGTSIFTEVPEINTEHPSNKLKQSIRIKKKKKILKKTPKFSSAIELNHKPKMQIIHINPAKKTNKPKDTDDSLFSLYHKHLNSNKKSFPTPSNSKPEKCYVSPLLNLKKITIKGIVKNQTITKTNQIDLKVNFDDFDISGWITNN